MTSYSNHSYSASRGFAMPAILIEGRDSECGWHEIKLSTFGTINISIHQDSSDGKFYWQIESSIKDHYAMSKLNAANPDSLTDGRKFVASTICLEAAKAVLQEAEKEYIAML